MRHFYFTAMFGVSMSTSTQTFGTFDRTDFPKRADLHAIVRKHAPGAHNIVILSLCEMSKDELFGLLNE